MSARLFPLAVAAMLAGGAGCGSDGGRATGRGGALCDAMVVEYAAAFPAALVCDAGNATGCSASRPHPVNDPAEGLFGLGCAARVNPGRTAPLDAVLARFDAAGCSVLPLPCPADVLHQAAPCPGTGSCE